VRQWATLIGLVFIGAQSWAASDLALPPMNSPVVDEAGLLLPRERREIENILYDYQRSGKAQIQVVIVKDLRGLPIEEFSIRAVEKWRLGSGQKDDGVLFLIAPNDRRMRIEVGQGLEGVLTDAYSRRILDDQVGPFFRTQKFAEGVLSGVLAIIQTVDKEYLDAHPIEAPKRSRKKSTGLFFFLGLMGLMMLLNMGRRRSGFGGSGWGAGSGWSPGGSGWSSGGGGGWSGGGGGFSGGGASSSW
jgi:uncharacterized protein